MRNEWKNILFKVVQYKDIPEGFVLAEIDTVIDKLDEDISKTTSIAASPFIKFMEMEVLKWRSTLIQIQDLIELWIQL